MSLDLGFQITEAGLQAAIAADGDGLDAKIKTIGFGAQGYTPNQNATGLRNERERAPISFSLHDGRNSFRVRGVTPELDPNDPHYWVREIGVFLEDGTLLALWSSPDVAIAGRAHGTPLEFDYKLDLSAIPFDTIKVVVTPGGDNVLSALVQMVATQATLTAQSIKNRVALEAIGGR